MEIIQHHLHHADATLPRVSLPAERAQLSKRRWRGVAEDGTEFGFDLEHVLDDGDVIFQSATTCYLVKQLPEPVLEIALPEGGAAAARLGWLVGNLHFALEVTETAVRVVDDPAVRQLCEREHLAFAAEECVFHPLSGGHSHSHHEH